MKMVMTVAVLASGLAFGGAAVANPDNDSILAQLDEVISDPGPTYQVGTGVDFGSSILAEIDEAVSNPDAKRAYTPQAGVGVDFGASVLGDM